MKARLLCNLEGEHRSVKAGEIVEGDEAVSLIAHGMAEPVYEFETSTSTAETRETATSRRSPKE
jgi:hypothetical protein